MTVLLGVGDKRLHGLVDVADILRNRPRIERRLFEGACDRICRELRVRTVVPFDLQGREPLTRNAPRRALVAMPNGSSMPSGIMIPTTCFAPPSRCQSVRALGLHASLRMLARRVRRRTR